MYKDTINYLYFSIFCFLSLIYVYGIKLKFDKLISNSKKGIYNNYIYYEADEYVYTDEE